MLRRVIGEQIDGRPRHAARRLAPCSATAASSSRSSLNLAVNARDAMPRGGRLTIRTATVWLDAAFAAGELAPGPHVLLEVADTGTGMDRGDARPHLRAVLHDQGVRRAPGSAWPPSTASSSRWAGRFASRARSDRARRSGSTSRRRTSGRPTRPSPSTGELPRGHETILIVEDDDVVRTFLRRALDRHGYRVLVAEHPTAGLALAKAYRRSDRSGDHRRRDAGQDRAGFRAAVRVDPIRAVPTLYISGYADAVLAREGTRPKASQFLQKPFSAADLLKRVRQILTAA